MSLLVFLTEIPVPAFLVLIGSIFLLLLLLLLFIVFVPSAAQRIGYILDILLRAYYAKQRTALTIDCENTLQAASQKEESK